MTQTSTSHDIDQLNAFLRGEISAVETYEQALAKTDNPVATTILRENHSCHNERVALLRTEIRRLGGKPSEGSGIWGAFAKAVEGGAKLFGESTAVSALEEGEDHGLKNYRRDYDTLTPQVKQMVMDRLLPAQQRTHDALSRLKKIMN